LLSHTFAGESRIQKVINNIEERYFVASFSFRNSLTSSGLGCKPFMSNVARLIRTRRDAITATDNQYRNVLQQRLLWK